MHKIKTIEERRLYLDSLPDTHWRKTWFDPSDNEEAHLRKRPTEYKAFINIYRSMENSGKRKNKRRQIIL